MKNSKPTSSALLVLAAVAMFCTIPGCGDHRPMRGHVRFAGDGTPLTTGIVRFETERLSSYGAIREDGSYVIGTYAAGDGLPAGTYRVFITGAERKTGQSGPMGEIVEPLIDGKFTRKDSTPLSVTVDGSRKIYDIIVEKPGGKR